MNLINCPCQKNSIINEKSSWRDVWEELKRLHNECPSVKLLIPVCKPWFKGYIKLIKKQRTEQKVFDSQNKFGWLVNIETCSHCLCGEYNKWLKNATAFHQSALVLALRRGHLNSITSPIHRYVLENDQGKDNKKNNALIEKWWEQDERKDEQGEYPEIERHRKYRTWMGRMAELKVAEWLEEKDWKIEGMEAWGDKSDIKAKSPDNKETLIEVKYIGQEDEDFKHLVAHLAGGSATQSYNPYVAFNFALFKIFEAAHQSRKNTGNADSQKEVALVICATTWDAMKIPLRWMPDSKRYRFFDEEVKEDKKWQDFLRKENLPENDLACMPATIATLNQITIFQLNEWQLIKEMEWDPTATSIAK